jgi:formylmethanofuran:tetrahydromethanopterin formyltransferase
MTNIAEVIGWKHNHQLGMGTVEGVITEFPGGIPSVADQATWTTEYESYLASTAYKSKRAAEYPSIPDQLDDIYHNGIDAWKATIKVTKDKYPK